MNHPTLGIIGVGWVGAQLKRYFEEILGYKAGKDLMLHDIMPERCAGDISKAEIIFLSVPTPRNMKDGSCDLTILNDAVAHIVGKKVIVIRSTVPPGTTQGLQDKYSQHQFLFNPEFLTESQAWEDMLRPDRQIVGFTSKSIDAALPVLSILPKAPFMSPWGTDTYTRTRISATEAEFIKYAGNVYFARKVNWANALAKAAEKLGANYDNIRHGMAADYRIGDSHLNVTHGGYRGWGGYCFPKDTAAFMAFTKSVGAKEVYDLLTSDWKFNEAILAEQGLTIDDVSKHIDEVKKILETKKNFANIQIKPEYTNKKSKRGNRQ